MQNVTFYEVVATEGNEFDNSPNVYQTFDSLEDAQSFFRSPSFGDKDIASVHKVTREVIF